MFTAVRDRAGGGELKLGAAAAQSMFSRGNSIRKSDNLLGLPASV